MKLTNTFIVTAVLGLSQLSNAMISPVYSQLRVFDAVALSFAKEVGVDFENGETMDDVEVSSLDYIEGNKYSIADDKQSCTYEIQVNHPPKGALGVPGYSAIKVGCSALEAPVRTVSYEVIGERLDKAAKLSQMVDKIYVTAKGKLKVNLKPKK